MTTENQAPEGEPALTDEWIDTLLGDHDAALNNVQRAAVHSAIRAALAAQPQQAENPNNCGACDHKRSPDGGWCYMFRDEPTEVCAKHTARVAMPAPAGAHGSERDAQEQPFEDWWEREGQFSCAGRHRHEKPFAWNAWCAALAAQPSNDQRSMYCLECEARGKAERQPPVALTELQIVDLMSQHIPASFDGALIEFARAIEAAHGIHAPQTKEPTDDR